MLNVLFAVVVVVVVVVVVFNLYTRWSVTVNSPPAVGGFGGNTFSINTYYIYSAIYLTILDCNSLEQAFAMTYSTY